MPDADGAHTQLDRRRYTHLNLLTTVCQMTFEGFTNVREMNRC